MLPTGGVLLGIFGGGVPPGSPNWRTLFQTKRCHFPHPFSDLASKIHTRFQTWRWLQKATYMFAKTEITLSWLRLEGLQDFPKVRRWAPAKSH